MSEIINELVAKGYEQALVEDVVNLLTLIGYEPTDSFIIDFNIRKVMNEFQNACHIQSVPTETYEKLALVIVANILGLAKSMNALTIKFEQAVKSLSMGDTSTTFADGISAEQQFDNWVASNSTIPSEVISCYRKIKW